MKKMIKIIALLSLIAGAMPVMAVDLTLSPIYTAVDLVRSALVTVVSPFASTTGLTAVGIEEAELRVVKDDVLEYFATGEATDRLISTVEIVQEMVPELEEESFDTVAVTMLEAVK